MEVSKNSLWTCRVGILMLYKLGNTRCLASSEEGQESKLLINTVALRKEDPDCSNIIINMHCGTHGAGFSYPSLAIYRRYFVPLWLENHFLLSIYMRYIAPLRLENHTFVIHLCDIYCTPVVGKLYLSSSIYAGIYCTVRV